MPAWRNWDGRQACAPAVIARPADEAGVAAAVSEAVAAGRPVKAVGSGHSFTDCACTDGTLVVAPKGPIAVDGTRATVPAGLTLHELGPQLLAYGLALENQGDIDAQTVAGAISTGTHGTGARFGNLSSRVVGARLVTADGDVRTLDGGDELAAARVGLGALGVLTAVTIDCVPAYTLHRHDRPEPLSDALNRLDDDADHFEFFVFPYTRTALTRTSRRSREVPQSTAPWRRRLQEDWLENRLLELVCRTGRRRPALVPTLNRGIARALGESRVEDHAHRVYATERRVRFTEMEYAIPRAHAREAIERTLAFIEDERLPILFPLEVRFAAADDALLSTAHGRETAYVAVHQFEGMDFEPLGRGVEAIMDAYDGRPHWGKRHFQTARTLAPRYPGWDRFAAVRAALDPGGVFANDYTRAVLA